MAPGDGATVGGSGVMDCGGAVTESYLSFSPGAFLDLWVVII